MVHFSGQVLETTHLLIDFEHFWDSTWGPTCWDLLFRLQKHFCLLLRRSHLRPRREKAGSGRRGRHLLGASGAMGHLGGKMTNTHSALFSESDAGDHFACAGAQRPSPGPQPAHKSWRAAGRCTFAHTHGLPYFTRQTPVEGMNIWVIGVGRLGYRGWGNNSRSTALAAVTKCGKNSFQNGLRMCLEILLNQKQ